jgi:DNA modification methylase
MTPPKPVCTFRRATYYHGDCFDWLKQRRANSIHGVVTDPPFALEYTSRELEMKRNGNKGGVWRLPPAFDGYEREPLPRFTTLSGPALARVSDFLAEWADLLMRPLVPGAHVLVASTPILSKVATEAIESAGFERRGEVIRLIESMRGGDRPKYAHEDYPEVSVIPKGMHEPWLLFRKPIEGRISENLERWGTGGLRRPSEFKPFGDVIQSSRAPKRERQIAPHPSLKPQHFLRQVVRAILPLGKGVVADTFAGSGSTLAAAAHLRYRAVGVESDASTATMAAEALPRLAELSLDTHLGLAARNGHDVASAIAANGKKKTSGRVNGSRPLVSG